ncbi:MAG: hypothetical protein ABEL51_03730 [Salinibacter sp.]
MTIPELLRDVASNRVTLWVEDGNLRYQAPKGGLDEGLRSSLAENKGKVLEFLHELRCLDEGYCPSCGSADTEYGGRGIIQCVACRATTALRPSVVRHAGRQNEPLTTCWMPEGDGDGTCRQVRPGAE